MNNKRLISIILSVIFLLGLFGLALYDYGYRLGIEEAINNPIVQNHYYTENITQVEYVDRPVVTTKIVYVDRPYTVFQPLHCRDFTTLAELEKWLSEDNTDMVFLRANESGVCQDTLPEGYDCDKYARTLQANAYCAGYFLSVYITEDKSHAVNLAVVGNTAYLVEPQNDDITELCPLD